MGFSMPRYLVAAACVMTIAALYGCGGDDNQSDGKSITMNAQPEIKIIDSHAHIYLEAYDENLDGPLVSLLESRGMKWLDICTIGLDWDHLNEQIDMAKHFHERYPERVAWATSFNLTNWENPDWEAETISFIADGFEHGAVAVKVWKEIGMELKDPDGSFVMIDDPRFDPIFDFVERNDKTLVCHLGEPRNCWLPLEKMTVNGDRNYFRNHPEYHAFLHPEIPSYERQIEARDRILEKHPNLRVVGCHLGSLEYDTDELAKRLDVYPNFAVDTATRIIHFKIQDRDKVRNFLIKYQDRVLYGTDSLIDSMDGLDGTLERMNRTYSEDYRYFATDGEIEVEETGGAIRGLALPQEVLAKIFFSNTRRWYKGI